MAAYRRTIIIYRLSINNSWETVSERRSCSRACVGGRKKRKTSPKSVALFFQLPSALSSFFLTPYKIPCLTETQHPSALFVFFYTLYNIRSQNAVAIETFRFIFDIVQIIPNGFSRYLPNPKPHPFRTRDPTPPNDPSQATGRRQTEPLMEAPDHITKLTS